MCHNAAEPPLSQAAASSLNIHSRIYCTTSVLEYCPLLPGLPFERLSVRLSLLSPK
jgi:hypothetical protein